MKILIIDDNQSVRVSLKMVLGGEFDNILAIGDPRLLPAILANGDFDAVLLDMNFDNSRLDGSDGLFWLARIKEMPQPPAVVLITAFGDISLAVEAMKRGGDDFITKPWDNDDLIAKLKSAIAKNRRNRSDKAAISEAKDARERGEAAVHDSRRAQGFAYQCGNRPLQRQSLPGCRASRNQSSDSL